MARDQIIKKILLVHLRSAVIKTVSLNQIFNKVIHPFKRLKEKRKCKKAKIFSINQASKGNKKYKYRFRKRIQVYSNPATFLDSLGTKNLQMDYLVEIEIKGKRELDQQQDSLNQMIIHSKIILTAKQEINPKLTVVLIKINLHFLEIKAKVKYWIILQAYLNHQTKTKIAQNLNQGKNLLMILLLTHFN